MERERERGGEREREPKCETKRREDVLTFQGDKRRATTRVHNLKKSFFSIFLKNKMSILVHSRNISTVHTWGLSKDGCESN